MRRENRGMESRAEQRRGQDSRRCHLLGDCFLSWHVPLHLCFELVLQSVYDLLPEHLHLVLLRKGSRFRAA